jgi:dolichol-phosphate mannosyltransferase
VIVQLAMLRLALWTVTDVFLIAQTFGVMVAMTTNFFLNNVLTYHDRTLRGSKLVIGLFSFYVVCSVGAVANIGVADVVFRTMGQAEFASLIGAVVGAMWNFVASSLVTWKVR